MKELCQTARNMMFFVIKEDAGGVVEERIVPGFEVILTVSEAIYREVAGGDIVRVRETETLRFHTSAAGLRSLSEQCREWADEAETVAERMSIEKG